MAVEIPIALRVFLAEHIDSASLLEVLLLLRAVPDRPWSPSEAARALFSSEAVAAEHLTHLLEDGLAVREDRGYLYAPGEHADTVDELATWYERRRHSVVALIYGTDIRNATTLADAFRLRRKKD